MAQVLEERVSRLEGAFEQMNERLGSIESSIGGLRQEIAGVRQDMNVSVAGLHGAMADLRNELHTNFRWTMGTIIAMWVTLICAILFA